MDPISATNPYSIAAARAYGVTPRASAPSFAPDAATPVAFAQRAAAVSDRVDVSGVASAARARVERLVAGSVDVSARAEVGLTPGGGMSVRAGAARESSAGSSVDGGSLPFYRSPSMANVAATSISAGRVLDVEG